MAAPAPAPVSVPQTAPTFGWDTVFAIHIDDVNNAIKKAMAANPGDYPSAWEATDDADGIAATGTFGAWSVIPGGSGAILRMLIPITAKLTFGDGTTTPISGNAHVDLRLAYLHDEELATKGQVRKHLMVRLDVPTNDPAGVPAIVVKIDFAGSYPGFMADQATKTLLQGWLNANLDDFDHVFASVDLDRMAAKDAFQWMQPTDIAYAYTDMPASVGGGMLAILCMTENRSSASLDLQVSPFAIPDGQRAGFLISKERLIEKMLLPCMPNLFTGSKAGDFALSSSGDSIGLVGSDTPSFKVKDKDGNDYDAVLTTFDVTIVGSELRVESHTETLVSPGVKALCHSQSFLGMQLKNKDDGTQALSYVNVRDPVNDHSTWTDPGFDIAKKVLLIIDIIVIAVATVLTGGAATVAIVLASALALGLAAIDVTLASEEYAKDGSGPEIGAMLFDCRAAIVWPDSKDFKLGSASLNESLQLGGDPLFAE